MCINCGAGMFSGDGGKTWEPVLPSRRCSKCGAAEGELHDEFLHVMAPDPLLALLNERIYGHENTENTNTRCDFKPRLVP